ncbi:hypothetical protein [Anaerococcus cruorum]|uniref:hypothetical protein n=1 Tax=Anaerococcus sp. WGS1596 TaxID=3366806 RepID=UPI00372D2ED4
MSDKKNAIKTNASYNIKIAMVRLISIIISAYILYNPPGSTEVISGVEFLSNDPTFFGVRSICVYIIFEQTIKLLEDIIYMNNSNGK